MRFLASTPDGRKAQPGIRWSALIECRRAADVQGMSWLRDPKIVLLQRPVSVTIGRGGFVPIFALGLLFGGFGARVGLPVPAAAVLGVLGGTASLIAHELGHVRAARKVAGLRPVSVSLIWLGAATELEGAYTRGRDQARVAIAGPATSLGVALLLTPILFTPIPKSAKGLILTLALLNVAIAALSLIPANPLDGYKLIVGLIWSLIGTESSALTLIRRVALTWMGVEFVGAGFLLVERPALGSAVLLMGASLYSQKLFARRSRA
jgi:Zn-dependent protease